MPSPVTPWAQFQPFSAKSLNLSLYTSDGTADNTTGISFATWRPVLFEAYNTALTLHSATGGLRTTMSTAGTGTPPGSATSCWVVFDSAGYFGQSQDLPAFGYYQFKAAVLGSTGDGVTPGGWYLVAHVAPVSAPSTQTSVGADLLQNGTLLSAGARQQPTPGVHSAPLFLDLVNAGANTFAPALNVGDSASANCALVVNTTDSSGETPRFYAIWAGISSLSTGTVSFTIAGTYTWTAPAPNITATVTGGGAGGGAGNSATSSFGGGGGGGGESAQRPGINCTAGNSYPVTVGAGGPGGAAAGANGANGGVSAFSGDTQSVTGHGGSFGSGATTTGNGAGGTGGTGSTAPVHFTGGAGASGVTNKFGGGGGSSAGTNVRGNNAAGAAGAPAPPGGGPGGSGGAPLISIVQTTHASVTTTNFLTVTMPAALSAGNSVLCFLYYQGNSPVADPVVTLSDGTPLSNEINGDVTTSASGFVPMQVGLYDCYNIAGGERAVNIACSGTGNSDKVILAEVYEVSGLGTSPTIDVSSSHTQGPSNPTAFYQASSGSPPSPINTTKAPELWVGMVGAQFTQSFTILNPSGSENWTVDTPRYATSSSGKHAGIMTVHQFASTTGNAQLTRDPSAGFSRGVTKGCLVAAYSPGAATVGQAPSVGPGGGGGGGFGQNAGANGADGQVTLSWTSLANANYGTPALPAPLASWDDTTNATAALVNGSTGIAGIVNFLASPPLLRAHATTAQSIPTGTPVTTVALGTTDADSYAGWNAGTGTYTVQRSGVYLCGAMVPFAANGTGIRLAGIAVNGTLYWGPAYNPTSADLCCATKTQMFSLNAGDTVALQCYQNSGGALNTATSAQARLFCVWLSAQGTPSPLPGAPDPGFRWQSGTPGSALPGLMTQHLSQDLSFLVQRPYLLAYQATAQTGLANNAFSTVTLDTPNGIVHGDAGDNYGGWTAGAANAYGAVVPGWYLVAGEFFTSSAAAGSSVIAGILPSTSGGFAPSVTPDWYQHMTCTANGTAGGGATVFGLYYLAAQESITPQVQGAAMGGTYSTLSGTGLGGTWRSHLSAIWMGS